MQIQISNNCRFWYKSDGSYDQDEQRMFNFRNDSDIFIKELQDIKLNNISSIFVTCEGVDVSFINFKTRSYECNSFADLIPLLERVNMQADKDVARFSIYENMANYLQGVVNGYCAYATSYGIGVYALTSKKTENIREVEKILDNLGVKYTNEYSDARWVYRFRISKSKKNIAILKSI